MTMILRATAMAALLSVALPVFAADKAPSTEAPSVDDSQKVVCHSEPVLGSIMSRKRVCKTKAEWRAFNADTTRKQEQILHGLGNISPAN
ncbi:hypothetical protein [Sphingobium aquiterrae]|uniref:hypothetical protein n=1 Tax=Sphingobium aquiterrae TaxID=2038656 RepID=UPI0030190C59